jgi:uncharacterized protein (AIM24 family)
VSGDHQQVARLRLKPGQEVFAEAGKMVYKSPNVEWETRTLECTFGGPLHMTYFRASGDGEIGFTGQYPGKLQMLELAPGQSILVQRDALLLAQAPAQLSVATVKRLGSNFFGSEGLILEKITGPGMVFVYAGGDFVEFYLQHGQAIQFETGCLVGFDETVQYDIQPAAGIKPSIFGSNGLSLATLSGPGRVIAQSLALPRLRRDLVHGDKSDALGSGFDIFKELD